MIGFIVPLLMLTVFAVVIYLVVRRSRADSERGEAMFRSMFPDLQPWYHPKNLVAFASARKAGKLARGPGTWKSVPGFEGASASVEPAEKGRDRVRLLDAAGAVLTQFTLEDVPEGSALRVGPGKLTVDVRDRVNPRVRYWHPDREFKWKNGKWTFTSRLADDSLTPSDSGTSFSRDSPGTAATAAAAAAGIVAAGGAFDGGGASQSWDDAGGGGGSTSDASTTTAY